MSTPAGRGAPVGAARRRSRRPWERPGAWLLLLLVACRSTLAATGSVTLSGGRTSSRPARRPSPPLESLPPLAVAGPLRILLVDDDFSDNNHRPGDTRESSSDTVFRRLVAEAVAGTDGSWEVEVVPAHAHGPGFERLRGASLVLWYTGSNYGGNPDNSAVLSLEDEKGVRRYLEEVGGAVILASPGYASKVLGADSTWEDSSWPFLSEVLGVRGGHGLARRFLPGVVTTTGGGSFQVGKGGVVETQFSPVHPDGAAVLFQTTLDSAAGTGQAVPVATAAAFGRGRLVYLGFSFENLVPDDLSRAFQEVLRATGWRSGAKVAIAPQRTPPTTRRTTPPPEAAPEPLVLGPKVAPPVKLQSLTPVTFKDVDFDNWGFEHGLRGWTKTGTAFDRQPTFGDNVSTDRVLPQMEFRNGGVGGDYWKDQGYPNGYKGRFWVGTYEDHPGGAGSTFGATQGDAPTGTLLSPEFEITRNRCDFLLGGGSLPGDLHVALEIEQADGSWRQEATRTSFRNSELLVREGFDLTAWKGKKARIRITDAATGPWGHIDVDDFVFRDTPPPGIPLTDPATNRPYLVDEDYPVWGIADTHAHPAHDDGFGNKLVVGKASDPLAATYSSTLCRANHSNLGQGLLNTIFIGGGDPHPFMDGWPDFVGFPRFNSKTHQQQHVDFLKRAWQGGLRLISALAVNNMYLPSLALGPGHDGKPFDDDSVIVRQLQDIKDIAASQSSWMEVAYTPKDARRIISQGKCAVVLGVETDNFGNFKVPGYNWNDAVGPANARLVSLTPANAEQLLTDKVNQYYDLGVRQVTPMHYLSGTFGGAAVFRGQIALIQFAFNNSVSVKSGIDKRIPYSLVQDYDGSMLAVATTPADYLVRIHGMNPTSTINALGMTDFGRSLVGKLMDKGMVMDSEHMGYEMKEALFAMAAPRGHPVISSHTDPAGLAFSWVGNVVPFDGSPEDKVNRFGTSNIRNLATEFNLADEHYQRIKDSGGTVGVFMLPYFKRPYQGYLGAVPNDCAGSTKTWAQMYLYSLDKMDGRGVALCTDRGMTDFIAPRFGPNAAYALAGESYLGIKRDARRVQRLAQRNGVRYDRPMGSFHIYWYHQYDGEAIDEHENDAWIAFAALEAGVPQDRIPASYYVAHLGRIANYVKGFRAAREADLEQPFLINGDAPWEQAAMYCLKAGKQPSGLAAYPGYDAGQKQRLNAIYAQVLPAWQTWNARSGPNPPLRRYRTGNRDWDFNTDGMAHYGMMPDFLQDLRNIGLAPGSLTPLLRSAEDYLRMWERSAQAAGPAGG